MGAEQAHGEYARTKAAGDAAVLGHFPNAVILRPAPVFGSEDRLFNRVAAMARLFPLLPLIGGGRTRLQPVYVGDVATAIARPLRGNPGPAPHMSWAARTSLRSGSSLI